MATFEEIRSRTRTGETHLCDMACPRCGNKTVVILMLVNEAGQHQHTHYVCTFYGSGRRAACAWHGWSIPGWDEGGR